MANLSTNYMGVALQTPIVVGASNMVMREETLRQLQNNGAGAIIFKSLFEEQLHLEELEISEITQEMDNRYRQMARAGVRNIESYNKKCAPGENMPFLVLVIDELADLMITAFDEVEHTLCRLAQLARATGIHIIVATQRPSVDVVTGLIKANFPTRMSFAVTSQVDSRTILDMVGAEKLLGRGDMLYMPTEESKPKRLQGTFVSDVDINKLVYFWGSQKRQDMRMVNFDDVAELVSSGNSKVSSAPDSLLEEARHLASEHEHISTSFLQRRLRIGYPRASRLMETLAEEGLTGASHPHEER